MAIQNPFRSDSSVPQSTDELTLIPSGPGGYLEMWSGLMDLEKLCVPVQASISFSVVAGFVLIGLTVLACFRGTARTRLAAAV